MIYDWNNYPYKIDDTWIDCWLMLITTCNPYIHEYVNPCDIVSQCLDSLWWPDIDRCDMIDDIPWAVPWAFLRIDNTGNCVEFINPASVFSSYNTDRMVSISWTDTAWYLMNKLVSTDWSIIISDLGNTLDLSSAWVNTFLGLLDTPSSYSWQNWNIVKVSWNSLVFAEDDKSQRGVMYLAWDETYTWVVWSHLRKFINTAYFEWNPSMPWSMSTDSWTMHTIKIQKTGMYHVWMNWWFTVNKATDACKMAIITTEAWDKQIILNSKVWSFTSLWTSWLSLPDTARWQERIISNFSESCLVKLKKDTTLTMAIRISWDVPPSWTVPMVIVEWQTHVQWSFGTWSETVRHKYSGTQRGVKRYSEITHNAI